MQIRLCAVISFLLNTFFGDLYVFVAVTFTFKIDLIGRSVGLQHRLTFPRLLTLSNHPCNRIECEGDQIGYKFKIKVWYAWTISFDFFFDSRKVTIKNTAKVILHIIERNGDRHTPCRHQSAYRVYSKDSFKINFDYRKVFHFRFSFHSICPFLRNKFKWLDSVQDLAHFFTAVGRKKTIFFIFTNVVIPNLSPKNEIFIKLT